MSRPLPVYLGTDSGATTSKTCGVDAKGHPISRELAQSSTNAAQGTHAVVAGWVEGLQKFLSANGLAWKHVGGVGLAIPGPYQTYGVLERSANLPPSFAGWNFAADYADAIQAAAGRAIPLVVGNDGNYGGVAEAAKVRGEKRAGVLMLAPGSGLGTAYVDPSGLPLDGDTLAGMEAGHMPAPLQLLGLPTFTCGCGRTWGCVEAYTTLSGLPQYLDLLLPQHPTHPLAAAGQTAKEKALAVRGLAQEGDKLALEIFDYQAKALGIHVANLTMAFDAEYGVIGGGLIDPEATTETFRARYLAGIRESAEPWLFPEQRRRLKIVPASLGELSQAIGAGLMALYGAGNRGTTGGTHS